MLHDTADYVNYIDVYKLIRI